MNNKVAAMGSLAAVAGFLMISTIEARAVDLLPPAEPVPAPLACCADSAWYIRGDIAYAVQADPDVTYDGTASRQTDWDNSFSLGVGLGYRFGAHLRVDGTAEYRFNSTITDTGVDDVKSSVDIATTLLLVNAYYDFGSWNGLAPYVGAGIGLAVHDLGTVNRSGGAVSSISGDTSVGFAAAGMLGVGYELTESMIIDLNYRYLYLGDASSGTLSDSGATVSAVDYDSLSAHEIRVGFRYEFR